MKILVRATNWVGDAVMSIPALEAVRRRWPEAEIAILARPYVAQLYQGQGLANRLIEYDTAGKHRGLRRREELARELRAEHFDVALLLQNAFDAAWLAWRAAIPERIGYGRDGRGPLLTRAVPVPRRGEIPAHESYYYLELLHRAGWLTALPEINRIVLQVLVAARANAEERLTRAGVRAGATRIALGPGASYGSAKCWLPERFASLADRLIEAFDTDVILFGTPAERGTADAIASLMRHRSINLAGETTIAELPALMAACHLFIGNDSGAMHVAGAVGLPVVGIFGPTDADGTAPATPLFRRVQESVFCSPCFLRRCPIDHRCMKRVTVEAAEAAARSWLIAGSAARV